MKSKLLIFSVLLASLFVFTNAKKPNDPIKLLAEKPDKLQSVSLQPANLGLDGTKSYKLVDVWNATKISTPNFKVNPNGVIFLKY